MPTYVDPGERCERHIGEVFPPRCIDCATIDSDSPPVQVARYVPFSECSTHRGWPMPCGRCKSLDEAHDPAVVKCDRHAGQHDSPRCGACMTLEHEYRQLGLVPVGAGVWKGRTGRSHGLRA